MASCSRFGYLADRACNSPVLQLISCFRQITCCRIFYFCRQLHPGEAQVGLDLMAIESGKPSRFLYDMSRILAGCLLLVASATAAQQNFINVPSGEVTKAGKFFFQQQLNFNEIIQSNTTLDYGLGKGFEIGLNVLGLNYVEKSNSLFLNDRNDRDPYDPLLTVNGLKQFEVTENFLLAIGTQFGMNVDFDNRYRPANLTYLNFRLQNVLGGHSVFVAGPYFNSRHYGGAGNRVGGWLAAEVPLAEKWHVMGESVVGDNAISYSSFGVIFFPRPRIPLTLGVQIPNTTDNAYALVFELTITP